MAHEQLDTQLTDDQLRDQGVASRALNRRNFLTGIGVAGAAMAGAGLLTGCGDGGSVVAATTSETDVLNFALNLEYLEATFYSYIVTGGDLPAASTGGGAAPLNPPGKPTYANGLTADLFAAIYYDEISHVNDLRTALGSLAIPRPQINLAALATINTSNFIQHARLFEDVGVTAYAGAATLLTANNLQAAAQILAVEGFHAGALRLIAIQQGAAYPATLKGYVPADGYDIIPNDPGTVVLASAGSTQALGGFFATAGATTAQTNTFPGFAYRRTTSQVLTIVYGGGGTGTTSGGFFPQGVNGNIKTV